MQTFRNNEQTHTTVQEAPFKLEKEIQTLFEQNLKALTSLKLVKSEFTIKSYGIDTLAFNSDSKAFVITEYMREQNYSVVDNPSRR